MLGGGWAQQIPARGLQGQRIILATRGIGLLVWDNHHLTRNQLSRCVGLQHLRRMTDPHSMLLFYIPSQNF